jgi:outer membrane protein TolC
LFCTISSAAVAAEGAPASANITSATNSPALPGWISQPLPLHDALTIALEHGPEIQKARQDVEAALGVSIQTRAIALPRLQGTSTFTSTDPNAVEQFPFGTARLPLPEQNWSAGIRIVQSIYEGGRVLSSLSTARLLKEQAALNYQASVADALLAVRVTYYDTLLARELIGVREASIRLLERQLRDARSRFDAGTVPRFNVLRAEVELANARPHLIRARNSHRIARQNLANALGFSLPGDGNGDIPLQLTDRLEIEPFAMSLHDALATALSNRVELAALERAARIRREAVKTAKSGYKPSVQLFAGYGARNSSFSDDLLRDIAGWNAGAQLNWNLFDGRLTQGRVKEAQARYDKSRIELEDAGRRVELDVRSAYSAFVEAREVLDSQEKVIEQAEEALRLANARSEAGTGTQLDLLSAQTALTESRSTCVLVLHDYNVALSRLRRAAGLTLPETTNGAK